MAQPYFTGNTAGAVDYAGMQQAMSMGLQGQQQPNLQGSLSTQGWVKNDMLPPQLQLQDQFGKTALQNNQVQQIPIQNMLQQQILSHQFGENAMQPLQQQMLQQQVQAERTKNQFTTPETYYQSLQSDLANHAKTLQENYGVNVGEAASELHQIPVTDPTGKQTMAQAGYDPNTQTLYVPPKTVMNPMLGIPTAMPAQQIAMPLGVHLFAKEVGAKQAGFQSYADMQQRATVQNLQAQQALLQQQKAVELVKYAAANPFGKTSPDIVSNGAPTLPGMPRSAQSSQDVSNYGGGYGNSTNPPNSSNPMQFQAMRAAMNPDDSFQPVTQNRFAQLQGLNSQQNSVGNYITNGLIPALGNATQALGTRIQTAPAGIMGWLNQLGRSGNGQYMPDNSGVRVPNYHMILGGGL